MPDAEWFENYANKIKLKTWKESDRFTKTDRLDLILANKLSKIKPELIKYATDPVKNYSLSARDKQTLATLKKYAPSLFKEVQPIQAPKTPVQTATEQAQGKAVQANVSGALGNETYQKFIDYGIVPDIRNKNWKGRIGAAVSFPLNKIISGFMAFPRAESAVASEAGKYSKEEQKRISELPKLDYQKLKYTDWGTPIIPKEYEEKKVDLGQLSKTGLEAFINKKGSEYQDYSWARAIKDIEPEHPITKPYEFAKDQGDWGDYEWTKDRGDWKTANWLQKALASTAETGFFKGNWLQKALGAVAGSPADILGFSLDIAGDPLTYVSGGAIKGYKVADISTDVIGKGGTKLVPKGATVVFTKAGKELLEESAEKTIAKITKQFAKEIADIGTDVGKKAFINRKVAETILKTAAKDWTPDVMSKFIDLGGLKFAGDTMIPGYEFAQKFGKSLEKVADIPFLKPINKVFNPYYGIPEALRPTKAYTESLARAIYGQDMAEIMRAVSPLSKAERNTLNTLMIAERDIAKLTSKSKITKLENIIKNLDITPKVAEAKPKISSILEDMFQREAKYIDYDKLQKYFPSIAKTEKFPVKTSILSAEEAFFQKQQTQDLIKMMKKGVEPEDLITALSKRSKAGALRISRAENLETMKQFGSKTWGEGLDELIDASGKTIKELKGWYFPAEYKNTFARAYQTFFGDDAVKQIFKVHDRILTVWKRWALATPGYHARNFWSDCWSGAMEYGVDFFNPRRWKLANDVNVLRKPIKIANQIYSPDDLAKIGMTSGTQHATEGMVRQGLFATNLEKASPAYWSMKFGNTREGLGRTVAGIIELEKGSTLIDAAFNVKKVFYDYMAVTGAEINIGKRIFPFYCVPDDSEILTKDGWKTYYTLKDDEIVLTYNIDKNIAEWQKIKDKAIFYHDQELFSLGGKRGKMLFTDEHKWVVKTNRVTTKGKQYGNDIKLVYGNKLNTWHSILMIPDNIDYPEHSLLTPEEAQLLGWIITDGYWRFRGNNCEAVIYQSPKKFLEIVGKVAGGKPRKPHPNTGVVCVPVKKEKLAKIKPYLRNNSFSSIPTKLSKEALEALYKAMYLADGTVELNRGNKDTEFFACIKPNVLDTFVITTFLLGKRTREGKRGTYISKKKTMKVSGALGRTHYKGFVWCPLTPNKTWVMRQNGIITITGNTWLRKNIQRQVELLFTRTGRYATTAKSLKYLENVAETRYGKEKMAEYKANQPDYQKDLGATITGAMNEEGQPLVLNPNLPFQDWARMNPSDLATSTSPLLKMGVELTTNKDLFFKTTIDRAREGQGNYREAPKWLSVIASPLSNDILQYMGMEKVGGKVFITDLASYLIRQIPPLYSMSRMLPANQIPKTKLDILSITGGIKFWNFDIDKEKKSKLEQFIDAINVELGRRKQTEEQIADVDQIERAYKQIYANYMVKQYPKYSVAQNIKEMTKYGGGKTAEVQLMIDLMEKPYNEAMDKIKDMTLPELKQMLSGMGINPTMEEINTVLNQLNAGR